MTREYIEAGLDHPPKIALEVLKKVRKGMKARSSLHVVESGDHSLKIAVRYAKEHGTDQEASDATVLETIAAFLDAGRR